MTRFNKGDVVDVQMYAGTTSRGIVTDPCSGVSEVKSGKPLVEVTLLDEGTAAYFKEEDMELALDEYEFAAVRVDLEDFEQDFLGGTYYERECWSTLEAAEKLIEEARNDKHYDDWKEDTQLQINRRRKAGPTVGYKTFRW